MLVPAELTRGSAAQLPVEGRGAELAKSSLGLLGRGHSHQTTSTGCHGELAVGTLRELVVYACDIARRTRRSGGEGLEFVAAKPMASQQSEKPGQKTLRGWALQDYGILAIFEYEFSTLRAKETRARRSGENKGKSDEDGTLHLWA